MFPERYIIIDSRQEYNDVIHLLNGRGYTWMSGRPLWEYDPFDRYLCHKRGILHMWPDLKVSIALWMSNGPEERTSKTISYAEFMAILAIEEEIQIQNIGSII